ncbi:galactose-specific lectin [Selaginella moellendorffii]|uniref:galactose-specific lectin n=1 Tax=Selaginella moellendorffii TaxID=88036 RepID=UPI000D1CE521|nr:galactose-specific lectin [Selaginella moellendorffii]|eukprot:XP_024543726.1 galactose-specific lectin [Selaginella moellendorffii]
MCTLWVSFIVLLMLTVWCAGEKSPLYGGTRWAEKFDDGPSSGILSLTIYSGAVVDAIQVQTVEGLRPFHGTNTCKGCSPINPPHKLGGTRYKINLRYPDEYIYKISGYAGWSSVSKTWGLSQFYIYIKNSVHGKTTTYGPFGYTAARENFSSKEGKIVGFWGYASTTTYMRGIGVYIQDPLPPPSPPPPSPPPSPPPPSPPPPAASCIPYQLNCVCCYETPSAKCCPEDYKCESYKGEWKYLSKCVQKYSFDA